ncbi:GNAT family N-acetyltransferase [Mesorhizobium sp. M1050]|uniref:GNAT family N-acetyltransferase n=1 Tax=Mesorhizobium sp. M1050 TaxID=2957051 RepID=UPI0033368B89
MRPIRPCDADALHRLYCDPLVVKLTTEGIPPTREMSDAWLSLYINEWKTHGFGFWMVYQRESNGDLRFVGLSGLRPFNDNDIAIGCYLFGDRSGQRIAAESLKPVIEFAFETRPINRLVSIIRPTNIRSHKMTTGLGFSCLGPVVVDGTDYQLYQMCRPPQ